jgi:hypothetical protein
MGSQNYRIFVIFSFIFYSICYSQGKKAPFLLDFSLLNLKITSSEIVDKVGDFNSGTRSANSEKDRIVLVTMTGNVTKPYLISLQTDDFTAILETDNFTIKRHSIALYFPNLWTISSDENTAGLYATAKPITGPISLKVAFSLPKGINKFTIAFPSIIKQNALLPEDSTSIDLNGSNEVRIKNPNDFSVKVKLRSGDKGKVINVPAMETKSVNAPNGNYDIYFEYSTDPEGLYQGDSFSLNNNGIEIQIVKVVNGNYGIRKIK